jgi:hypothetical protein
MIQLDREIYKLLNEDTPEFLLKEKHKRFAKLDKENFSPKFYLTEEVDIEKIKFCLWFLTTLSRYHKSYTKRELYSRELVNLNKYLEIESTDFIKTGNTEKNLLCRSVVFGYNNQKEKGRYYSNRHSFQNLSSTLRYLLLREDYFDFDLRSSHLSILYYYFNSLKTTNGKKLQILNLYVENRDLQILAIAKGFIQKIKNLPENSYEGFIENVNYSVLTNNIKSIVKQKFIVVSNKWKFDVNTKTSFEKYLDENFCKPLFEDVQLIRSFMMEDSSETFLGLKNFVKSRESKNFAITLQNFYCYHIENKTLDMVLKDEILGDSMTNIPISDGVMLKKELLETEEDKRLFCVEMNKDLSKSFPGLKLVEKELTPKIGEICNIDLEKLEKLFSRESIVFDNEFKRSLKSGPGSAIFTGLSEELKSTERSEERYAIYENVFRELEISFSERIIMKDESLSKLCSVPDNTNRFF